MVSRDIKIATKKKFNPNVMEYKTLKKDITNRIDLRYFKEKTNTSILKSRMDVLFKKGRFKDSEKAKKTINRYNGIVDLTTKIFLSKVNEVTKSKVVYLKKGQDFKEEQQNQLVLMFTKELKKLSREGLKVEFIEDLNPVIDRFLKDFQKKINFKVPKES